MCRRLGASVQVLMKRSNNIPCWSVVLVHDVLSADCNEEMKPALLQIQLASVKLQPELPTPPRAACS